MGCAANYVMDIGNCCIKLEIGCTSFGKKKSLYKSKIPFMSHAALIYNTVVKIGIISFLVQDV